MVNNKYSQLYFSGMISGDDNSDYIKLLSREKIKIKMLLPKTLSNLLTERNLKNCLENIFKDELNNQNFRVFKDPRHRFITRTKFSFFVGLSLRLTMTGGFKMFLLLFIFNFNFNFKRDVHWRNYTMK
jgi:hypothetical protein